MARAGIAVAVAAALLAGCKDSAPRVPERALPGAPALAPELRARLHRAAAARRAAGQRPRTRHLTSDGAPRYVNRLALESSPYLLQHAHNPVAWWPWGDEAFAEARRLRRPVLLSVGYSTCHWCHVMEEESFDDEATARVINARYVAIKVDREVRPDVDAVYMQALLALRGSGGWPMNLWLTPDRHAFHAGTYFPPVGAPGRPAFRDVLTALADEYARDPESTRTRAAAVADELGRREAAPGATAVPEPDAAAFGVAAARIAATYDPVWGGMRGTTKFPQPPALAILLRHARRGGDPIALELALRTLEHMATGGLHDQVGGGFHRYSTDERWVVPHFEKMLYDSAQLAPLYLEGAQASGRYEFVTWARDTLDFMARDLRAPDGLFASALDADTAGVEGATYVWTPEQIDAAAPAEAALLRRVLGVEARGTFDARASVLQLGPEGVAAAAERAPPELARALAAGLAQLRAARARRPQPGVDKKRIVGWNALAISAFARAGSTDAHYLAVAQRAAHALLARAYAGGRLAQHLSDAGPAVGDGFLDDHAFLLSALLDLYEADGDPAWLATAHRIANDLGMFDAPDGGYYFTSARHDRALARQRPEHDGAIPGGHSVAALALLRLSALTSDPAPRARALRVLAAAAPALAESPQSLAAMLLALDFATARVRQIVLVTPAAPADSAAALAPFRRALATQFVPARVVAMGPAGTPLPLFADRTTDPGRVTAYVCIDSACDLPTSDPASFAEQITRP